MGIRGKRIDPLPNSGIEIVIEWKIFRLRKTVVSDNRERGNDEGDCQDPEIDPAYSIRNKLIFHLFHH